MKYFWRLIEKKKNNEYKFLRHNLSIVKLNTNIEIMLFFSKSLA